MSELSPLPVEKQKLDFGAVRAAFSPAQTSAARRSLVSGVRQCNDSLPSGPSFRGPMDKHGWIALGLGTFFSLFIGCGLMALMFFSSRSGHDEAADPFRKPEPPVE